MLLQAALFIWCAAAQTRNAEMAAFVRANYTKYEYRIAMRDGVKLFTSVYVPKDVFQDEARYPIMLTRTPYSVRPYGIDQLSRFAGTVGAVREGKNSSSPTRTCADAT